MTEDILKLKSFLLNPKRSDEFVTWYYLDGWRFCTVKVGSKKASVTPKFGKGFTLGRNFDIETTRFEPTIYHRFELV